MRFKGLDLNLLVVFDTLMQTRSVSRTAEQLKLSQPAISSALRRLRGYFGDDILISHGKRMFPTAYSESLMPQVRESLRLVEGLIGTSSGFDPATSQRAFRICASDYLATTFLAPLSRRLADVAPGVRLEFRFNDGQAYNQLAQGLADLIIMPDDYRDRDVPAEHFYDENFVVAGWRENPLLPDRLGEAEYMAAGHIQVSLGHDLTRVFSDRHVEVTGRERRIEVSACSFAMVPWLIMGTQRLALMHQRLAEMMMRHYPIAIAPVPFEFPVMPLVIQYNAVRDADPGLSWLRAQLHEEALRPISEVTSFA